MYTRYFGSVQKLVVATAVIFGANSPSLAGSAKLTFTASVAKVENGIGMAGDHTVTKTFRNVAAISFVVTNPGKGPQKIVLSSYDAHFRVVDDISLASSITLPTGGTRRVFAYVPVANGEKRRLRICAEGHNGRRCGKFIAQHLP